MIRLWIRIDGYENWNIVKITDGKVYIEISDLKTENCQFYEIEIKINQLRIHKDAIKFAKRVIWAIIQT